MARQQIVRLDFADLRRTTDFQGDQETESSSGEGIYFRLCERCRHTTAAITRTVADAIRPRDDFFGSDARAASFTPADRRLAWFGVIAGIAGLAALLLFAWSEFGAGMVSATERPADSSSVAAAPRLKRSLSGRKRSDNAVWNCCVRTLSKTRRPNRQRAAIASNPQDARHKAGHAHRDGRRGQQHCCPRSVAAAQPAADKLATAKEKAAKAKAMKERQARRAAKKARDQARGERRHRPRPRRFRPSRRPSQPPRRRRRTTRSAGSGDCRTRSQAVGKTCGRKETAVELHRAVRQQTRPRDARGRLRPARGSGPRVALAIARLAPPRHSGAMRSIEPGIHLASAYVVRWIPGSCFARPGMTEVVVRRTHNCTTGKSRNSCPASRAKIFRSRRRANQN